MRKSLLLVTLASCICGSAIAMTERVYYAGGWVGYNVNTVNYKALARDYHHTGNPWVSVFGAREDGTALVSVSSIDGAQTFIEQAVVYRNYKALTGLRTAQTHTSGVLGILADSNVVEMVYYNDTAWVAVPVVVDGNSIDDYKALSFDSSSAVESGFTTFYAARTDGAGVDQISWTGGQWVLNAAGRPTTVNYKAICTNYGNGNPSFIGVRADGSRMDQVYYLNGSWTTSQINSGINYDAIADIGMGTNDFACSKTDGSGIDQVYWSGSAWVTNSSVWPEYYKTMASMNGATNNQFFGSYVCDQSAHDINNDCFVDLADLADLALDWLDCGKQLPGSCI